MPFTPPQGVNGYGVNVNSTVLAEPSCMYVFVAQLDKHVANQMFKFTG